MSELPPRRLLLEGVYNLRDLGGYATTDGQVTRWGRVLRSDQLCGLPDATVAALLEYGIATIIDLRRPQEALDAPNSFAAIDPVRYRHLPLFDDQAEQVVLRQANTLVEVNQIMLARCGAEIAGVMRSIAEGPAPLIFHCAVGKDRTGLLGALLLRLANVPDETIIADYALSAEHLAPLFAPWREKVLAAGRDPARFDEMTSARPETIQQVLLHLDDQYGGAESYLRSIGLSSADLQRLRSLLLDPQFDS